MSKRAEERRRAKEMRRASLPLVGGSRAEKRSLVTVKGFQQVARATRGVEELLKRADEGKLQRLMNPPTVLEAEQPKPKQVRKKKAEAKETL